MADDNTKYGYVSIYRSIFDNYLWEVKPFSVGQAWIDLILLANHKPKGIRVRGKIVSIDRGQTGYSAVKLGNRWGWSRGKVNRFLNELEMQQQIVQQKNNITTVITISNYERYQKTDTKDNSKQSAGDTASGQQTDSKQYTNNKVNNINKENNKIKRGRFTPPALFEVENYISEKKYQVDPQRWYDFYQSKGWFVGKNMMRDWKAAVRTWVNRRDNNGVKNEQFEKFDKRNNQSFADQHSAYGIEIQV